MPFIISQAEIRKEQQNLQEFEDRFAEIPDFKMVEDVRDYLAEGYEDFSILTRLWNGEPGRRVGFIKPIEPWGRAELGFSIDANSIDDLIDAISRLIHENKNAATYIYFRCFSPDMKTPTHNNVEESRLRFLQRRDQYMTGYPQRGYIDR